MFLVQKNYLIHLIQILLQKVPFFETRPSFVWEAGSILLFYFCCFLRDLYFLNLKLRRTIANEQDKTIGKDINDIMFDQWHIMNKSPDTKH